MKLITRDTDYAVRALVFISKAKEGKVSVSQLVKELKMPRPFLRKILQILHKKRILKAAKGYGGGFRLAKRADEIYLLDLMKIFQRKLRINQCIFKKKICPDIKRCKLKKKIDRIQDYVISELKTITIRDIL